MERKKKQFGFKKSLIYSLIIIGVIFSVLETASYFVLTKFSETGTFGNRVLQNVFHPYLGWVHPANAHLKSSKPFFNYEDVKYINTDKDGLSITPLSYDKPELVVVITGGSSTFGVGSTSNSTTVPSQLERKIVEQLGVKAEVVNLGSRGYNSFQELLALHTYLLNNPADIVIALSGHNDATSGGRNEGLKYALLAKDVYDRVVPLVRDAEKQHAIVLNPDSFFREHSHFFDLAFRLLYSVIGQPSAYGNATNAPSVVEYDPQNISERVRISLRNYAMMKALSESANAKFVFALQPDAFSWVSYPGNISYVLDNRERFDKAFDYMNVYSEKMALGAVNLNLADLRSAMDTVEGTPYVDSIHYNDLGAAQLASALIQVIKPIISEIRLSQ